MTLEELTQELNLNEDAVGKLSKLIQSETDKVRTDYSQRLKTANEEIEKFKPKEPTPDQIEYENTKKELNNLKFAMKLKEIGVSDDLAKYLKADIDLEDFGKFYKGFNAQKQDYVAKKHVENAGVTKEQFNKMTIAEKTKLYNENPELYAQLRK
ncbi:MAG: hypothetical protein KH359_01955 [Clostridiales bacterium]|nr:hypothetical protein [Clostridiales bacterium]